MPTMEKQRMIIAIYFRNTVRIVGLLAFFAGGVLLVYQGWVELHGESISAFYLSSPESVTRWLSHASPLLQALVGLPWVILVEVPLPLLLLIGGAVAMRI